MWNLFFPDSNQPIIKDFLKDNQGLFNMAWDTDGTSNYC